jgi:hypothetical protein
MKSVWEQNISKFNIFAVFLWSLNSFDPSPFRFNEIGEAVSRPSILGPGFSAPPGGMEYLDRD